MKDRLVVFLFDQTTYCKDIQGRPWFISWNLRANRFFFSTCGQILDLTRNCLFKGVRLRKVSHWPPWLIKIFRKRVKEVRKRVSWKFKILIAVLLAQELLGHADFEVVGDLPDDVGPMYSHDEGPSKVKMFRDTGISRRPYYVRGY